ncbi:hypothetical protein PVAND_008702 [Polypedilum vanderplanki]|uniref:Leucine rich repeat protein n=1 Tax=Polypedilum vanderplanki TaxID=319348 RepID=A0A9J6CBW2_POLVA|nr:hypothetical protein PVAND_008702 [Polypedilum vanderplanki]
MKLNFLILIFMMINFKFPSVESVTIKCNYFLDFFNDYSCTVMNREIFKNQRVCIDKVEGKHLNGKTDDDVHGFYINKAKNMKFFPSNINKIFINLKNIVIIDSNLTEITSEDLKVFPKLKSLYLPKNQIKVIKEDTFSHNPDIEVIYLLSNEISHIDRKSFSKLEKLKKLTLLDNFCNIQHFENRNDVLEMVKKIEKGSCKSDKFKTKITSSHMKCSSEQIKINFLLFVILILPNLF